MCENNDHYRRPWLLGTGRVDQKLNVSREKLAIKPDSKQLSSLRNKRKTTVLQFPITFFNKNGVGATYKHITLVLAPNEEPKSQELPLII